MKKLKHELLLRLCGLWHTWTESLGTRRSSLAKMQMLAVGSQAATVVGPMGLLAGHPDLLPMSSYLAEHAGCFRSWETLVIMSGIPQVNNGDDVDRHGPER